MTLLILGILNTASRTISVLHNKNWLLISSLYIYLYIYIFSQSSLNCRYSLIYLIFLLFRRSMDESIFSNAWKISFVTPILKIGGLSNVTNYRRITILPRLSKIFEFITLTDIKRSLNHIIIDQ